MSDATATLLGPETLAQEIRRSRFRAVAGPVEDEAAARHFIAGNSEASAGHNCWAFRCGDTYRFSDDGEPGGTAGRPILQAIEGQGLDGVAVVVSRWFGGILLGSGGLMRAYGGTAAACLRAAARRPLVRLARVWIACPFAEDARIRARLAAIAGSRVEDARFTASGVCLCVALPAGEVAAFTAGLADLTRGQALVSATPPAGD